MERVRMLAQLTHLAQHCDFPAWLVGEDGQCRAHRGGIGVVALVDHQGLAARQFGHEPRAASRQTAHLGEREARHFEIAAGGVDRGEDRHCVRDPMFARLRDGEAQLTRIEPRGDEGPAGARPHPLDCAEIGAVVQPEGDDPAGVRLRSGDEAVAMRAVVRNDRGPAGLQPLENLAFGVGDRRFAREEAHMRRRDRGDQGDMPGSPSAFTAVTSSGIARRFR